MHFPRWSEKVEWVVQIKENITCQRGMTTEYGQKANRGSCNSGIKGPLVFNATFLPYPMDSAAVKSLASAFSTDISMTHVLLQGKMSRARVSVIVNRKRND